MTTPVDRCNKDISVEVEKYGGYLKIAQRLKTKGLSKNEEVLKSILNYHSTSFYVGKFNLKIKVWVYQIIQELGSKIGNSGKYILL